MSVHSYAGSAMAPLWKRDWDLGTDPSILVRSVNAYDVRAKAASALARGARVTLELRVEEADAVSSSPPASSEPEPAQSGPWTPPLVTSAAERTGHARAFTEDAGDTGGTPRSLCSAKEPEVEEHTPKESSLFFSKDDEVEGFFYGDWFPGKVRQCLPDDKIEVLWAEDGTVSHLECHDVRRISSP